MISDLVIASEQCSPQSSESFAEVVHPVGTLAIGLCPDASITKLWSFCHGLWFQSFHESVPALFWHKNFDSINFFDASFSNFP